jgi:hypothetical protein
MGGDGCREVGVTIGWWLHARPWNLTETYREAGPAATGFRPGLTHGLAQYDIRWGVSRCRFYLSRFCAVRCNTYSA